jgi:methylenetetrahydrofolate reductase (NADPH)
MWFTRPLPECSLRRAGAQPEAALNEAMLGQEGWDETAPETRARISALIAGCSLESTTHQRSIAEACTASLAQGTSVYVTALPRDTPGAMIEAAKQLWKAGLNPVPHLGARYFAGAAELDACLARLVAEAGVRQVLAIGGDIDRSRGSFASSRDLIMTGLLEKHGIARVGLAAYPERHKRIPPKLLDEELAAKIAMLRARGLAPYVVTQFCFEAGPIEKFLTRFPSDFPDVPVHVGLAGPAKVSTLLKYATACGIGTSLRALSRRLSLGKLLTESGPEPIIAALARSTQTSRQIARLHFFTFGGIRRTVEWAATFMR